MAKGKITPQDFLALLESEDSDFERPAFAPAATPKGDLTSGFEPPPFQVRDETELNMNPIELKSDSEGQKQPKPNLSQSMAKHEPNLSQSMAKHKPTNRPNMSQSRDKRRTQPEPKHKPIMSQSVAKHEPNLDLEALVGLQRGILFFVYDSCRRAGQKISPSTNTQNFVNSLKSTVAAVRKAIQRLVDKGFLIRQDYKDGRGGWTRYRIPDHVYGQLLQTETMAKHEPNMSQSMAKRRTQPEPQPEPNLPSSSSNLLIKESTTTQIGKFDARQRKGFDFLNLDAVGKFGIGQDTIARAFQLNPTLSQDQVEDLISRFARYGEDPKNKIQNARGFFLELAKQAASGITPLDHIESDSERMLREYVERLREARSRRVRLEQEALELEFENWISPLTGEERNRLVPPNGIFSAGSVPQTMKLKEYFRENIWAQRRIEIESNALQHQNSESD